MAKNDLHKCIAVFLPFMMIKEGIGIRQVRKALLQNEMPKRGQRFVERHYRLEKVASLRDGLKSQLMDLILNNPRMNRSDLINQTNHILTRQLTETDSLTLANDKISMTSLSREIAEKIESAMRFNGPEHGRAGLGLVRQDSSSNKRLQEERI